MQTKEWGRCAWDFLHTISFNYPINPSIEEKKNYKFFFENLKYILPCNTCRYSYMIFIDNIKIDKYLDDRYGIVYWVYTIHNLVNIKLNYKLEDLKSVILKYEKKRILYTDDTSCCSIKDNNNINNTDIEYIKLFYKIIKKKYINDTERRIQRMIQKYRLDDEIIKLKKNMDNLDIF
jgi:hypothetical protein